MSLSTVLAVIGSLGLRGGVDPDGVSVVPMVGAHCGISMGVVLDS
jgi:hypothetical protein